MRWEAPLALNHVASEGRRRTNPVWALRRWVRAVVWMRDPDYHAAVLGRFIRVLASQGVVLLPGPLAELSRDCRLEPGLPSGEAAPGVVGLAAEETDHAGMGANAPDDALVVPLVVVPARVWSVAQGLPFSDDALQTLLSRLLDGRVVAAGAVPERLAFRIEHPLGERIAGPSMHVAGLLALVAATAATATDGGARPPLLRAAAAVVQLAGDGSGGIEAVERIPAKLAAFVREYGRGSLLVRTPSCAAAAAFDGHFDTVWTVSRLGELADRLSTAGLLAELLRRVPLTSAEQDAAAGRLRVLKSDPAHYRQALDLARRLTVDPPTGPLGPPPSPLVMETVADLYRHLGRYEEAIEAATTWRTRTLEAGSSACYDDLARADVGLAASLFDGHCFARGADLLDPWDARLAAEPRLLPTTTRVMVWNTLGRLHAVLGRPGCERLFLASIELQRGTASPEVGRSRNYLIHALLRRGELDSAARRIAEAEAETAATAGDDEVSRRFLAFFRADLARRRGDWADNSWAEHPARRARGPWHPLGFYEQAAARQPGRTAADAAARLARAAGWFRADLGDSPEPRNALTLLACFMDLARAGHMADPRGWTAARTAIAAFLAGPSARSLAAHYAKAFDGLPDRPDPDAPTPLLDASPYF